VLTGPRTEKIGVTSNNHKATNNLLAKVEKVAIEANFRFRGAKRWSGADQRLGGSIIQDVAGNNFNWSDMNLVAVANLVAMGLSARNLVLLGNQMQLGQPIQGDHPV
jgi:uncharacterized protein